MNRRLLALYSFAAAAAGLFLGSASAASCGNATVLSATSASGEKVELVLDSGAVEKTPEWKPGSGDPPLAVAKATQAALEWGKKHFSRFDGFEISRISLSNAACSGGNNHWYYVFEYTPIMAGNRMYGGGNWAAILMDGTLVEAKASK